VHKSFTIIAEEYSSDITIPVIILFPGLQQACCNK